MYLQEEQPYHLSILIYKELFSSEMLPVFTFYTFLYTPFKVYKYLFLMLVSMSSYLISLRHNSPSSLSHISLDIVCTHRTGYPLVKTQFTRLLIQF